MSSIVKAKALGDLSKNPEYYKARVETFRRIEHIETPKDNPLPEEGDCITEADAEEEEEEERNEETVAILSRALTRSNQIGIEAESRAESLYEKAKKESRQIFLEAEREGYEQGYNLGLLEGRKSAELLASQGLQEVEELARLLRKERRSTFEKHQKDVITIAFELAKKIMKQQAEFDENFLLKLMEDLLHENEGTMKIYLSEYQKTLDLKIDKSISKLIRSTFKDAKVIMLQEEDKIMVETHDGVVDMSIPVQMKQLETAVEEMEL